MNILVTGARGFIAFNALQLWVKTNPENTYIALDNETYADKFMLDEKTKWLHDNNISMYIGNISDYDFIERIINTNKIDTVINFAAESHVDNSIKNPNIFFETNVMGTVTLLNLAKKYNLRMHQIGTDEVYGVTHPEDHVSETSQLKPSSPYSASKTSADLIALSYFTTFGTRVTVSRCTNNVGPWQHSEKLVPTVIRKALADEKIPVYGDGLQRRHWISVDEHNRAIMNIVMSGKPGEIYNIAPAPENYISNMDIITFILDELKKPHTLIEHVTDRLGHDTSYFLYDKKYQAEFGSPVREAWQDILRRTVEWYKTHLV